MADIRSTSADNLTQKAVFCWPTICVGQLLQIGIDLTAIEIVKGPLKRDKRLTVRVPEAVLERLRIVALADGRSIADWALRAIEREIELAEAQLAKRRR